MKRIAFLVTLISLIGCLCCPALSVVYAEREVVPDNVYGQGQNNGDSDITPDDVKDIFGQDDDFGKDNTGYSDTIVGWVKKIVNIGIKVIMRLFPTVLATSLIVDGLMIFHPFFADIFANKCPIRLYSKECESYTGYHYTAKKNDNGGGPGGDTGGPGGDSDSGGSNGKKSVKQYFINRSKMVILCTCWIFMAYSGILGALLYKVVAIFSSVAASWIK